MTRLFTAALLATGLLISSPSWADPVQDSAPPADTSAITVLFKTGSTAFAPDAVEAAVLDSAKYASMITVYGRTSTPTPSAKDASLALARAVSARQYLVTHGVSPLKIMLNYASAVDYAVPNNTRDGQALNQRVDIELFFVPDAAGNP